MMNLHPRRVIYIITIYLFITIDASDVRTIEINGSNLKYTAYSVDLCKPLTIFFKNFNNLRQNIRCSIRGNIKNLLSKYDSELRHYEIKVDLLTNNMITVWECSDNETNLFIFKLRVKKNVNVTISGEPVSFQTETPSNGKYEGIYNYICEEGETLDFTCTNFYKEGKIRLQYHDRNGTVITEAQSKGRYEFNLNFRMFIRDKDFNQSYADCTYLLETDCGKQEFTYRTLFTVSNITPRSSNGFSVYINDMKLTAKPRSYDQGSDRYTYKYIHGQALNITCAKKNPGLLGAIHRKIINIKDKDIVIKDIVNLTSRYTASIESSDVDGMIFQCYSECKDYKLVTDITFSLERNRDPFILGLTAGNILYEYNTGNMEWIIHYQYAVGDKLNLTCITAKNREPHWTYLGTVISRYYVNLEYGTKQINYIFIMNNKLNQNITCESTIGSSTHRIIILLHRIPQRDYSDAHNSHLQNNEKRFMVFEIIGIVVGILMAIFAALFAWNHCRSKKAIDTKEGCYRSSLSAKGNEYTYIENVNNSNKHRDSVMILNSMYCKNIQDLPSQKDSTGYSDDYAENLYTEIAEK